MAGHNKWSKVKRLKAVTDSRRGKIFSRLARDITLAAKSGGGNPEANARLRTLVLKAREANMPADNVDRAIKKGTGELPGVIYEEITYEAYGPGGVAFKVECLTDNRNRSASEVRMVFDRCNGNMAGSGAVSWMFHRKAHFVITGPDADENKLMDIVLDAGAEDIEVDEDVAEIWGPTDCFEAVTKALADAGIKTEEAELMQKPENVVEIKDINVARQVLRMIDKLEDLDDVQNVTYNSEIDPEILEQLDAEGN